VLSVLINTNDEIFKHELYIIMDTEKQKEKPKIS